MPSHCNMCMCCSEGAAGTLTVRPATGGAETWAGSCGNELAFITQEYKTINVLNHEDAIFLFRAHTTPNKCCCFLKMSIFFLLSRTG